MVSVIKVAPGNMELVEVAPRLDKLKLLLSENPYSSREASEFEDLEEMDKRADYWLFQRLEIDGYWRIVDEKYMSTILIMLLHNSVLNDWSLDALNEDEAVEEGAGGSCLWRLDERRVCVHFAREILVEGKRKMDNFMEEWKQKVPKGMHPDFEMLEGEVLKEKFGVESWVHAFSVSSLPSTPAERFSTLFRERPKWEQKDLLPYIRTFFGRLAAKIHAKEHNQPWMLNLFLAQDSVKCSLA
ncbi:hypothetical protein Patl1_00024 [Pistacia atlantica]|uniref:Uncharacterized protein n=1 Tax=Pistacia atlantica TaxID=434234 RepID=A0ACC1C530_9ROSI|nr:hypothetical protein Patl1_00024 [Pistacia atlantica]